MVHFLYLALGVSGAKNRRKPQICESQICESQVEKTSKSPTKARWRFSGVLIFISSSGARRDGSRNTYI